MDVIVDMDKSYVLSEDIVARDIQGEFIIIPVTSGISDADTGDVLFTLNETGKVIWDKLNGKKSLKTVVEELSLEFEISKEKIKKDVSGLAEELLKRKMIVRV